MRHWLMKTDPDTYSIDDLERDGSTHWEGVRNYQARNLMRDEMKVGDPVLIYHSSADPPCVVGTAKVSREAYPDFAAWDPKDPHFDPKSSEENPRWMMVDVEFVEKFPKPVSLGDLKKNPKLDRMMITRKGMRLSIQPVEKKHFEIVRKMGGA